MNCSLSTEDLFDGVMQRWLSGLRRTSCDSQRSQCSDVLLSQMHHLIGPELSLVAFSHGALLNTRLCPFDQNVRKSLLQEDLARATQTLRNAQGACQ